MLEVKENYGYCRAKECIKRRECKRWVGNYDRKQAWEISKDIEKYGEAYEENCIFLMYLAFIAIEGSEKDNKIGTLEVEKDYVYCRASGCIHSRECKRFVGNYDRSKALEIYKVIEKNGEVNAVDCNESEPFRFYLIDRFRSSIGEEEKQKLARELEEIVHKKRMQEMKIEETIDESIKKYEEKLIEDIVERTVLKVLEVKKKCKYTWNIEEEVWVGSCGEKVKTHREELKGSGYKFCCRCGGKVKCK